MSDDQQHDTGEAEETDDGGSRLDALIQERRDKLAQWRERGVEPYPVGVRVEHSLAGIRAEWDGQLEPGQETDQQVAIAGRIVLRRGHGKLVFLVLREWDSELQVLCQLDVLGEDGMAGVDALDVGDWAAVHGRVIASKRGELSVQAQQVQLIGKSLRPLPDKWHGVRDVETRFRQRYADLIVNA